jgi:hypothetical protein
MATVGIAAAIEIDGVRYSHHIAVSARSWQVADETTREAFRERARDGLGEHLAATLPIEVTVHGAAEESTS